MSDIRTLDLKRLERRNYNFVSENWYRALPANKILIITENETNASLRNKPHEDTNSAPRIGIVQPGNIYLSL
jgi:hypothetical protein